MKYTAVTYDGVRLPFDGQHYETVLAAMKGKEPVELPGGTVNGADIRRIEEGEQTGDYGPHLTASQYVAQLASGGPKEGDTFWEHVLKENMLRKAQGKPWLYAAAVKAARDESGFTSPKDVLEFLDAEWDSFKELNVPEDRQDWDLKARSAEFYASEKGKAYAAYLKARGWD